MIRLNPVFEKELRMFERSIKISWVIFIYNLVLALATLAIFYFILDSSKFTGSVDYANMIQIYIIIAYIQFGMLLLIVPGLTAGAISGERERQTLDILLSTQMKPWQIIIGKLESSLSVVLMLGITSIPIVSIVFVFGGIKLIDLIVLIILLFVEAIFIGSIGLLFSSVFKKTTSATVLTYTTLLFVFLGTYLVVQGYYMFEQASISGLENEVADIKGIIYLLLINPIVTFTGLINWQVGSSNQILAICNGYGNYDSSFVVKYWIWISMGLQLVLSIIFIIIAQAHINPLRERKLFEKRNRNSEISHTNT